MTLTSGACVGVIVGVGVDVGVDVGAYDAGPLARSIAVDVDVNTSALWEIPPVVGHRKKLRCPRWHNI